MGAHVGLYLESGMGAHVGLRGFAVYYLGLAVEVEAPG